MERVTKTANEGYMFTQIEEVPIEQRVWGKVIDTAHIEKFHEVPISEYEKWQKKMDKLMPIEASETDLIE